MPCILPAKPEKVTTNHSVDVLHHLNDKFVFLAFNFAIPEYWYPFLLLYSHLIVILYF